MVIAHPYLWLETTIFLYQTYFNFCGKNDNYTHKKEAIKPRYLHYLKQTNKHHQKSAVNVYRLTRPSPGSRGKGQLRK